MNAELREVMELPAKWRAVAKKQRERAEQASARGDDEDEARWAALAERSEYCADELDAALAAAGDGGRTVAERLDWPSNVLNRETTLSVLTQHNAWRRGAKGEQTDPRMLGLALEAAISYIAARSAGQEPTP